ncbi:MAG: rhodanese-like domain-containing protein [Akkermansiaceae bacterium]|nr:rhodanese-like domain-containing protein [Akkermansiaceae bacterium]
MSISPKELHRQLDSDTPPLLLDVRTPSEFKERAIPGAVLMPIDQLDVGQVKALAKGLPRCVTVCHSGVRSKKACDQLREAGLEEVESLEGGVEAWDERKLPLHRASGGAISIMRQVQITAGSMVLIGVILTVTLNPWWAVLPGFFGAGLAFAGLTGSCGLAAVLNAMPWNKS